MRTLFAALALVVLAIPAAFAQDNKAKPTSLSEVADAVMAAVQGKDDARVKELAAKNQPDPWLVADELCARGEADAADAFARAAPRVDVEKLPDYVAARRGKAVGRDGWKSLFAAGKSLNARKPADALATLDAIRPDAGELLAIHVESYRGLALRGLQRLEESAAAFGRAADAAETLGWLTMATTVWLESGTSAESRSDFRGALAAFERRLAVAKRRGGRASIGESLAGLGRVHRELGNLGTALSMQEESLRIAEELNDRAKVAELLGNIGNVHLQLGNLSRALEYDGRSLALLEALRDRAGVARLLNNIGAVHETAGDYAKALGCLDRAFALDQELGRNAAAGIVLANLGWIRHWLGDDAKAFELLARSIDVHETAGDRANSASSLAQIGAIHGERGEYDEAIAALERAAVVLEDIGDRGGLASCVGDIAETWRLRGDLAKARAAGERALALARQAGERVTEVNLLGTLGDIRGRQGDRDAALALVEEALAGAREVGARALVVKELENLATLRLARGEFPEAVRDARSAVSEMSQLVGGVGDDQQAGARCRFGAVFDVGAGAAAKLADPAAALFFLESGRAGTLLASLHGREALRAAAIPERLRSEEAQARAAETAAAAALRSALDAKKVAAIALARRDLDAARDALRDAIARIQREAKAVAGVLFPTADTLDMIRGRLHADEVLVLFGSFSEDAGALVVRAGGAEIVPLGNASAIEVACAALTPDDPSSSTTAAVAALRKLVVDPLALDSKVKRVLVSPDGALSYVPFALLLPDREVCYVPSGTTYGLLLEDAAKKGETVLALGDPDYGAKPQAPDAVALRGGLKLDRLPATGVEARAVGDVVLTGKDASEAGLRDALAKKPRWHAIHLACHGLVDAEKPTLSALALTPSGDDDGFLTALEVFQMKVPGDLVVLSACETGKGRVYRAEGIVGLTRAFMFAGAPRVLVSLWKVDDKATSALMTRFYEGWKKGLPAARALAEAQGFIRSQEQWKHPFYWAAWALWGLPE